jgi:hypothetical protein
VPVAVPLVVGDGAGMHAHRRRKARTDADTHILDQDGPSATGALN